MKQFLLHVLSGIVAGFVFWMPIVVFLTFYIKRTTGGYPPKIMGSANTPMFAIVVGTVLGMIHGFFLGLALGLFKVNSYDKAAIVLASAATAFTAICYGYTLVNEFNPRLDLAYGIFDFVLGNAILFVIYAVTLSTLSILVGMISLRLFRVFIPPLP